MAFNCSYRSLNDNNIRHIYSDQRLRIIFPKRTQFRCLREELPIPPLQLYPKRFYDYYPAYRIGIPRAPAFRGTDQSHVDDIVKRICKPMKCEKERRHGGSHAENEAGDSPREEQEENKMSPRDMDALIARLQRPTQSWEKKKYDRDEREREREMKESSSIPKLPPISSRI